jgi:hypothetical protein
VSDVWHRHHWHTWDAFDHSIFLNYDQCR